MIRRHNTKLKFNISHREFKNGLLDIPLNKNNNGSGELFLPSFFFYDVYALTTHSKFLVHYRHKVTISPLSLTLSSLNCSTTPEVGLFPNLGLKSTIINIFV